MRENITRSYKKPLLTLIGKIRKCNNYKFNDRGLKLLCSILNEINKKLVAACKQQRSEMSYKTAMKAVELFPEGMKIPARNHATAVLAQLQSGVLLYKAPKETGRKKVEHDAFRKDLSKLLPLEYPQFGLTFGAQAVTSKIIHSLATAIAAKTIQNLGEEREIRPNNVRLAASHYFGSELLPLADGHAMSNLMKYKSGLLDFKIRTFRVISPLLQDALESHPGTNTYKEIIQNNLLNFRYTMFKDGYQYTEQVLSKMASRFISRAVQYASEKGLNSMSYQEIDRAVRELMPPEFLTPAKTSARQKLLLYESGVISYKVPHRNEFVRLMEEDKECVEEPVSAVKLDFRNSIKRIAQSGFPSCHFGGGLTDANKTIISICEMIAEEAIQMARSCNKILTKHEIQLAIQKTFPPAMLQHALAHISKYESSFANSTAKFDGTLPFTNGQKTTNVSSRPETNDTVMENLTPTSQTEETTSYQDMGGILEEGLRIQHSDVSFQNEPIIADQISLEQTSSEMTDPEAARQQLGEDIQGQNERKGSLADANWQPAVEELQQQVSIGGLSEPNGENATENTQ